MSRVEDDILSDRYGKDATRVPRSVLDDILDSIQSRPTLPERIEASAEAAHEEEEWDKNNDGDRFE